MLLLLLLLLLLLQRIQLHRKVKPESKRGWLVS